MDVVMVGERNVFSSRIAAAVGYQWKRNASTLDSTNCARITRTLKASRDAEGLWGVVSWRGCSVVNVNKPMP